MKVIGKIGVQTIMVLVLVLSGALGMVVPVAQAESVNHTHVDFQARYGYDISGDSFSNAEVIGHRDWSSGFTNDTDGTGLPAINTTVALASGQSFERVEPDPVVLGPPSYEWSFDNVPEGRYFGKRVSVGFNDDSITYTPGFNASRSVDKTSFSASGSQTLTVNVTAQQSLPNLKIDVRISEDENVIPTITSPLNDETQGIYLAPDGQQVFITIQNPAVGTTYTYDINIQVILKDGVSEVEYMPWVGTHWYETLQQGTISGETVTHTMTGVGTWEWNAAGSYDWYWNEGVVRHVGFGGYSRRVGNQVGANFGTEWVGESPGDIFTNGEITGQKLWRTDIHNRPDETGAPVVSANLSLDSDLAFNGIMPDPATMGPPTYIWSFGDVSEDSGAFTQVLFESSPNPFPVSFTPGFDASRTADKIMFAGVDNQTLTITVTPRQDEQRHMFVAAHEDGLVNPVITSPTSGGRFRLSSDGHKLDIDLTGLALDTPWSFNAVIEVTPKVAEVEFMPHVNIKSVEPLASGITSGSSLSCTAGDPADGIGTWEWNATGSYEWDWEETLTRCVNWQGYSIETGEPGGTISGRVLDSTTGQPIGGAHLNVFTYDSLAGNDYQPVGWADTDINGNYTTTSLPTGQYGIQVHATDYVSEWYQDTCYVDLAAPVTVIESNDTPNVNFDLEPGGTISGRVTDTAGQPISDAWVDVDSTELMPDPPLRVPRAKTNAQGYYTTRYLPAGQYTIRASAIGYVTEWYLETINKDEATILTVTAPGDTSGIDFSLKQGGTISGQITDTVTGQPISNTHINAIVYDSLSGQWLHYGWAQSDDDGYYTTNGLPDGQYAVKVDASGYITEWYQNTHNWNEATPVTVTAPGDTSGVDFSLELGGTISGRVTDTATGQPISDAVIDAIVYDSLFGYWQHLGSARTNIDGYYTTGGLPSGDYAVRARVDGTDYIVEWHQATYNKNEATPVTVTAPGNTPDINFSLEMGGTISGQVIDTLTGQPVSGANINVIVHGSLSGPWLHYSGVRTDTNGNYRTTGLPDGQYAVRVDTSGYATEWYQDKYNKDEADAVSVTAPNETLNINFSLELAGSISGYVYEADGMTPVSNCRLNGVDAVSYAFITDTFTGADGGYTLEGLYGGNYLVRAQPSFNGLDYADQWYSGVITRTGATLVPVVPPGDTPNIDFNLEPAVAISGTVQTETGDPLSGANVFVARYDLQGSIAKSTQSGADGSYRITNLPPGDYTVIAFAPEYITRYYNGKDYADQRDMVSISSGEATGINFSLRHGAGSISGYLYEADGVTPLGAGEKQQVSLYMYAYDGNAWVLAHNFGGKLDLDGRYAFPPLAPGDYEVRATAIGYLDEWYAESGTEANATPVTITVLTETSGINFNLSRLYETQAGDNVTVDDPYNGVIVEFASATTDGSTSINISEADPSDGTVEFRVVGKFYDISTDVSYTGTITITITYDDTGLQKPEKNLKLWHWDDTHWSAVDSVVDEVNNTITGVVDSLSWFAVGEINDFPVAEATAAPYLAQAGSEFTFDGSASVDPDGTIVSYEWDFGDGNTGSGATATHAYEFAGLYNITLTVTDDMEAQSTDSVMAVVYDPAAGFATGGGWFIPGGKTSYNDDFLPDIDGTSPANFGFVVKYKKGASTPDGQLEFQYQQGDFNLHSSGMEWLVILNKNWAKFHGTATIKGIEGLFPFRVDARDGDFGGRDQPDRFIIKVYPPGGDPEVDDPIYKASGDLQGGSIVIHGEGYEVTTLRLQSWFPADAPLMQPLENFAQAVEQGSGGSVLIELYPSNALVPNWELANAVEWGDVEMGLLYSVQLGDYSPVMGGGSLPFLYNDDDGLMAAVQAGIGDLLSGEMVAHNITTIDWTTLGISHLLSRQVMLDDPGDITGLKIRAPDIQAEAISEWGGTPVVMPARELYMALRDELIDGAVFPLHTYDSFKLYEVAPYFCVDYAFANLAGLCINSDIWNSLDENTRQIMMQAAGDCVKEMLATAKQLDAAALQRIQAYEGVEVYELSPEERLVWREASQVIWQSWVDGIGPVGQQIIDIALEHNPLP